MTQTQTETFEPRHLKRWTMPSHNYYGEVWPVFYSAGVGQSRDSDPLEQSNFATMLQLLGGEDSDETIIVVRESHWAVGWVEWIAIHQDNETALRIADEAKERLEDYPILDENDFSEREQQAAAETWQHCYSPQERIRYIRAYRSQFEFHDLRGMLACVRGQYFAGYASELIYR